MFEDSERDNYYGIAKSLTNETTEPNQLSLMANIELMQYCLSNKEVEIAIIQEKTKYLIQQKEKSTLEDIDDLPVEALYLAAQKLNAIGEKEFVKVFANEVLKMIGELRSIRKEFFEKILQ